MPWNGRANRTEEVLTPEVVRHWLRATLAALLHLEPTAIDIATPFASYGIRPRTLIKELEAWLGRTLPPTLLYEYPTITLLADHLAGVVSTTPTGADDHTHTPRLNEAIAIIGMGCRFPGGANSPAAFWHLLREGIDAISEVPDERWDPDAIYDPDPDAPGKINTRRGGFIEQVDTFDAAFFGISPREAARIDPQQRLLLEVAWEAFEDAGLPAERLAGSQAGVFIGGWLSDYGQAQLAHLDSIDPYVGTGSVLSILANRLSYVFDLHGPSMAIDTACSSSMSALHAACQSLRTGETTLALAGGTNLLLSPAFTINFTRAKVLSPDGSCKTFDARANGYVRSEGVGLVVLKRLADAQRDGDPISAVIRGSVVYQDGLTNGLMAPNTHAQEAMLRTAYHMAGVAPHQVQYIEAHGTGTYLGDPIEANAIERFLAEGHTPGHRCMVGSVKSNIGHLEAAAGVAGVIKVALMLKHRTIVPNLHYEQPNPHIAFETITVPQTEQPWESDGPRLAGVSSFGFGGTIGHIVLEEAPDTAGSVATALPDDGRAHLLPISAKSPQAARELAQRYAAFLRDADAPPLRAVCATASLRRSHHPYRLAVVGGTHDEMAAALEAATTVAPTPIAQAPRLVFVFPGQGSQWVGMGQQLIQTEPVFREMIERCEAAFAPHVPWSLTAVLQSDNLGGIDTIQPVIFAVQVALAALWQSWGIEPAAVVGHSMGEAAAAYVAGALSLEDAARVICRRSTLLHRISGRGAMAVVELSWDEAQEAIAADTDRLAVAVSNSRRSTVLSGDPDALDAVLSRLEARGVFCRRVKVDVASHSPQVDALCNDLRDELTALIPLSPHVPMISCVTAEPTGERPLDASYWVRNLRAPVRFADAVEWLIGEGHTHFLEVSPHPVLVPAMEEGLVATGAVGVVVGSCYRGQDERASLLSSLGALYAAGHTPAWDALHPERGAVVALPSYPWQHERYWLEGATTPHGLPILSHQGGFDGLPTHPLLGSDTSPANDTERRVWLRSLTANDTFAVRDHCVGEIPVLPGAACAELLLHAAIVAIPGHVTLVSLDLEHTLSLDPTAPKLIQTVLTRTGNRADAALYSQTAEGSWMRHALAALSLGVLPTATSTPDPINLTALQARCTEMWDSTAHYQAMQARGLAYGTHYRSVQQVWRREGEALARLREDVITQGVVPHATLDGALQTMLAALPSDTATYLPIHLGTLALGQREGTVEWCHATLNDTTTDMVTGTLSLLDVAGTVLCRVVDVRMQRIGDTEPHADGDEIDRWLYERCWKPSPLPVAATPATTGKRWFILADRGGLGGALADLLTSHGDHCVLLVAADTARTDLAVRLRAVLRQQDRWHGIIHLWSLDAPAVDNPSLDELHTIQFHSCGSALSLVQVLAAQTWRTMPRLWLVTRGAQAVTPEDGAVAVAQSPLWGLGQVLPYEHAELRCTRVDMSAQPTTDEIAALAAEVQAESREDQVALRGQSRYVARLERFAAQAASAPPVPPLAEAVRQLDGQPIQLVITTPGLLETMTVEPLHRRRPGPGEVEIEVHAAGMNFRDVLLGMGALPQDHTDDPALYPGFECAGRVVAVGDGVSESAVGQDVVALAEQSFASFAITPHLLTAPMPPHLTYEEAATIPLVFATAYQSLYHAGRLAHGERVLIHAATGGVGLALVQLAQCAGAEIFATAGSEEKRDFLRSLGVPHVFDSRSLSFADEVMRCTNGEGVDVVINSLGGEFIERSFGLLRDYGRFVEIGQRDYLENYKLGMQPFLKNLSFSLVDLRKMWQQRPERIQQLLHEVLDRFSSGACTPLPRRVFPIEAALEAFQHMARAKHIGKMVLSLPPVMHTSKPSVASSRASGTNDATYLISGGTGGLGLVVAHWLAGQGVRNLVLLSRRGETEDATRAVAPLREQGVQVHIAQANVASAEQVRVVFDHIDRDMPPLRGVIHAAGVLDDALMTRMQWAQFDTVFAPKLDGAWNLHMLTRGRPLDVFILFSSVVALIGSPGQANYAAANAFLDALAHHRRAQGLPALSIAWGPWADVGLAAAQANRGERMAGRGMENIVPAQGAEAFGRVWRQVAAHIGVVPLNVRQWLQFYPKIAASPLLDTLVNEQENGPKIPAGSGIRAALLAADATVRPDLMERYLREQVAQVVRLAPERLEPQRPFIEMGFDSLMTLELRNRLEAGLGTKLPGTLIWSYPTIDALGQYLAEQLEIDFGHGSQRQSTEILPSDATVEERETEGEGKEFEQLSDDELAGLLYSALMNIEQETEENHAQ